MKRTFTSYFSLGFLVLVVGLLPNQSATDENPKIHANLIGSSYQGDYAISLLEDNPLLPEECTPFFIERFETDGNGDRYTTNVTEFVETADKDIFFTRTDETNIASKINIDNISGSSYFAAMDTDGGPGSPDEVSLSITGINISGYTNLGFKGLFAEDDSGSSQHWDTNTSVFIEAQIDGGGFTKILAFESSSGTVNNEEPAQDTNFDGIGDGTTLTENFTAFSANIIGTGSTLDLRVRLLNLDADNEDFAFDDLSVCGIAPPTECISFFTESFESDGNGDRYTTNVAEFVETADKDIFFTRTDETNIASKINIDNISGSSYFAAMDTDGGPGNPDEVSLSITGIDITGYSQLQFSGLFAEDDRGSSQDWDASTSVFVEAQIDGEGFAKILAFEASDGTNSEPAQDTNFDGEGDGVKVTDSFSEFSADIIGTGALLDIRIRLVNLDSDNEDFAFDDLSVCGTAVPVDNAPPVITNLTPADDATEVAIGTDLTVVFDEPIFLNNCDGDGSMEAVTGIGGMEMEGENFEQVISYSIMIFQACDNQLAYQYELCGIDAEAVVISENTATISLPEDFLPGTEYYVIISPGAFEDASGNENTGITDPTTWNFTTAGNGPIKVVSIVPDTGFLNSPVPDPFIVEIEFDHIPDYSSVPAYANLSLLANGIPIEGAFDEFTLDANTILNGQTLAIDFSEVFEANVDADSLHIELLSDQISNGLLNLDGNGDGCSGDNLSFGFKIPKPIVIPYMGMFEECSLIGDWQVISVDTDDGRTWSCSEIFGNFSVNGEGDNVPANDWLISPEFNLDATVGEVLSFDLYTGGTDSGNPFPLSIWFTTDFTGDPNTTQWNVLPNVPVLPELNSRIFTTVGPLEIGAISGDRVQFAFQYQSSGNEEGTATEWRVDNFFIKELAAEFLTDDFICIDDPIKIQYQFFGGTAPFYFVLNDEEYELSQASGMLSLNLPLGEFTTPGVPLNNMISGITDANGKALDNVNFTITPFDCAISNLFKNSDPCDCNNDQSINGAQDGSFSETVSIRTTRFDQIWTVQSLTVAEGATGLPPAKPIPTGKTIAITEFFNDADGISNSDANREYIELFNFGLEPINVQSWTLEDGGGNLGILPDYEIPSGGYMVLVNTNDLSLFATEWFGGNLPSNVFAFPDISSLNNSGDQLILLDDMADLVWSLAYPGGHDPGFATFFFGDDLSLAPNIYGSEAMPGVDFRNEDFGIPGFLGYQSNDRSTDPLAYSSTNGEQGSPGIGNYQVISTKDIPIESGQALLFDPIGNRHIISFLHFDDSGYKISVEGPNAPGSPNNRVLEITNVCAYPVVSFDPTVLNGYPKNAAKVDLNLVEENNFPEDPDEPALIQFGNPIISSTEIVPIELTPMTYPLTAFYKADSTESSKGTLENPSNPGCITNLEQMVIIRNSEITNDSCICRDQVNVLLEGDCSFALSLSAVTLGDCVGARLIVNDGNPANDNIIDCPGTFTYGLFDGYNNLFCWGNVYAEDKTPPSESNRVNGLTTTFDCAQIDKIYNQASTLEPVIRDFFGNEFDNPYFMGYVEFEDNCIDCGCSVETKFVDAIEYFDCESINEEGLYARITRTWSGEDCEGNVGYAYQIFNVTVPPLDSLFGRTDLVLTTCDAENAIIPNTTPFWLNAFGEVTFLSQICNYAYSVEEGPRFEVCNGTGYKFERYYKVIDWCKGTSEYVDTVLIKVGDFQAPAFGPQADTITGFENILDSLNRFSMPSKAVDLDSILRRYKYQIDSIPLISTGPFDCTAALDITIAGLRSTFGEDLIQDNCTENPEISVAIYSYLPEQVYGIFTGDTSWVKGNYNTSNIYTAIGIPCGVHALVVDVQDDCYNGGKLITYFQVRDKVAPVMKCDDQLNVTLTNGDPRAVEAGLVGLAAYARVDASDVNEGSEDNCSEVFYAVRRSIAAADFDEVFWVTRGYDNDRPGSSTQPDGIITEDDYKVNPANGLRSYWEYDAANDRWFTPYEEYVEFFCFDAGQNRIIELFGADRTKKLFYQEGQPAYNSNTCWLDILIEDGSNVWITDMDSISISCEDARLEIIDDGIEAGGFPVTFDPTEEAPALAAAVIGAFGAPELVGTLCRGYEWTIDIYDERDHCGFNYFEIEYTLTTSGKNPVSLTKYKKVKIYAEHDYWIKFPKDAYASCEDAIADGLETSDPEDNACDLLAVSHTDEQFVATTDTSCYKIFRTWKVINWCEYDGEALPVIVGRDWDNWNGRDCAQVKDRDGKIIAPFESNIVGGRLDPGNNHPDGDDDPGDEDIYVIVKRNFGDDKRDVVYYDQDNDPFNNMPDNKDTENEVEGYWWKVVSGSANASIEQYYESGFRCLNSSGWGSDGGVGTTEDHSDLSGSTAQDDDDYRYGSFGFWQYTQHVVVYDDSTPQAVIAATDAGSISNFDCSAETTFTITISDACSVSDVAAVVYVNGTEETAVRSDVDGNAVFTVSKRREIDTYKIKVEITDGCGNFTTEEGTFDVFDDKAPAPICHEDLVVELMPTDPSADPADNAGRGMASVWASDFLASPVGDCSGQGPEAVNVGNGFSQPVVTKFSINRVGEEVVEDQLGLELTCDDADDAVEVEIHAWDMAGNHDFCKTLILVQDNNGTCGAAPGTGEIAGAIATETGSNLEGVEVQLSGERSMVYMTDVAGNFVFDNLAEGNDYTVTPQLDIDPKNGVSTFDLILIQKHILGELLDSPYKMIAGDVNNSGKVTVKDLIDLRKLILNIDTDFANNTSWRFVDAAYNFADPSNPFAAQWPEIKNINNLDANAVAEFVGIKIGDVNNSATLAPRSATGTLAINVAETSLITGNEYTVTFAADMAEISGYQFTLDVDQSGAQIVDLVYGAATAEHFGVFTQEGVITTSYNGETTGALFSLVIRATADVNLSDVLTISSRYTNAEAYTTSDDQLNVALNFTGQTAASAEFALFQNTPNPFQGETLIGFNLPNAGEATIILQDVAGRTVKLIEGDFVKGYNQVKVKSSDLPSAGVFFYTLTAGDFKATKKLMIIDEVNR